MKKSRIRIVSNALISASLRGLAVFAIFGLSLYAYAAISYPANQPTVVSGVVGLYVGKTAPDTGSAGGYLGVQSSCNSVVSDSHVCTPMEMINTYRNGDSPDLVGTPLASETQPLWLNSGAPAYFSSLANDCLGWTEDADFYGKPVYGSVWSTTEKYGMMTFCNQSLRFACCK